MVHFFYHTKYDRGVSQMTGESRIQIFASRWFAKFAAKEKISDAALV